MGPSFTPIKSCILNQNLQKPTPRNQENIVQLVCEQTGQSSACTIDRQMARYNSEFGQLTIAKKNLLDVYVSI